MRQRSEVKWNVILFPWTRQQLSIHLIPESRELQQSSRLEISNLPPTETVSFMLHIKPHFTRVCGRTCNYCTCLCVTLFLFMTPRQQLLVNTVSGSLDPIFCPACLNTCLLLFYHKMSADLINTADGDPMAVHNKETLTFNEAMIFLVGFDVRVLLWIVSWKKYNMR